MVGQDRVQVQDGTGWGNKTQSGRPMLSEVLQARGEPRGIMHHASWQVVVKFLVRKVISRSLWCLLEQCRVSKTTKRSPFHVGPQKVIAEPVFVSGSKIQKISAGVQLEDGAREGSSTFF